ncbi:synaptotagmin-8 isoform X2 [Ictidomys tridecemlineatus]
MGQQAGAEWPLLPGDLAAMTISQGRRMGRPPGPSSPLAPAGTTAMPGLIPDLISGIPWPRWALILVALAASALIVSCLLCAFCCCRRRHKNQPRDKEAVGLGSARSSTTTHLVQPDVDRLQGDPGDPRQWGRLQLSLEYDLGREEVKVGLKQAADLRAGGTADPYVRVSVSTQPGHGHETKVHHGTLCPVFEETCCFHVPQAELPRTTLHVRLLDFKPFSEHRPLGELHLPLGAVDPQHVLERWYQLGPPGPQEPEQTGELCFSLRYVPSSGRLTVVVLEARGLSPGLAGEGHTCPLGRGLGALCSTQSWAPSRLPRALREGPAHGEPEEVEEEKDLCQEGHGQPLLQRGLHLPGALQPDPGGLWGGRGRVGRPCTGLTDQAFLSPCCPSEQSVDLVLAVWAHGLRFRAEPVGKVLLGSRASGQPLQHWADMLAHARRPIAQWHRLRPAMEVDSTLALRPRLHLPLPGS